MPTLGVNIDHIATVREARKGKEPDPVIAAMMAEQGGADGIVVHLREDRRHIQDRDLHILRETIQSKLDLEMAATEEMVKIALAVRPEMVTLVPEKRLELTTEGGLNLPLLRNDLKKIIPRLTEAGICVSVFIEPSYVQIKEARALKANTIEIHTGHYANNSGKIQKNALKQIVNAARVATRLGLAVNAGHGLNYFNVRSIALIPNINELNIGHSIVARATLVGMERAVREMKSQIV
ncbi:MAG: pyridoxine 5'-phosphate synthase [Nitrospirae bacterium]|nr:pyridoxine 5'-phosphate synthase [Candidatus Troglogloeales bacterium]MBI3598844.1 pyridoxine 5'-phosphate synthase [Candidatus Troglogloeales bacterium]